MGQEDIFCSIIFVFRDNKLYIAALKTNYLSPNLVYKYLIES
jgi:hypothetical protein